MNSVSALFHLAIYIQKIMDFLSTDSGSLFGRITTVESTHAQSNNFHLWGLLLSTLKFTFESQISRPQEKSPQDKITRFLDYLGKEKKKIKPKKIHINNKAKNPKQFICPYKKTLHLISVKAKAHQAKPGLRMTQCFFINPDWMKTVGIKTPWFWQTLAA